MNTTPESRLLELYDRVAEAPDAIERLRKFVLDLAVRGKLVEQDPEDEPEPELLEMLSVDKVERLKPPLSGWIAAQLGNVLNFQYGKGLKKSERLEEGPVPVFGSNGIVGFTTVALTDNPSIIVGRKGSAGALNLCDRPSWTTDVAYFVEAPQFFDLNYLFLALQALNLGALGKGVKPGLSRADAYELTLSIPPLPEQHRIVAKVDELMNLLDRLETTRTQRETTRDRLTTASLTRLTAPDTTENDFPGHARFALENLDQLTNRPDQIKVLRQTILNLAVRGKLVEQDPGDEPAEELLSRIAQAKLATKQTTGDKRIKQAPTPEPDLLPIDLPVGWSVQSFENLFLFIDYRGKTPPKTTHGVPLITAKNVRTGSLNREPREFVSQKTFETWMTRGSPKLGDLFFTTEAPLANSCLNNISEPFALAQRVICLHPFGRINTRYLMFAVLSDVMQDLISEYSTGLTAKGIKAAKLKPLPLPIPPLDEQHRIVAKVDTLMKLCDKLDVATNAAASNRIRLLDVLLHDSLTQDAQNREAA